MTREQTAALEWAISELNEIGVLGSELRHMDELCRLRAALSAPKAEAVTVKPLVWDDVTISKPYWKAYTPLGSYLIQHRKLGTYWWRFRGQVLGEASALEYSKAAAQADYEARILSAIDTSPVPAITDEVVERAADWLHENLRDCTDLELVKGVILAAFPSKGGVDHE